MYSHRYFCLQIGSRTDVVSVDCLKPVFSDKPVSSALPPAQGHPALQEPVPIFRPPVVLDPPPAVHPVRPGWKLCSSYHPLFLLAGIQTELFEISQGSAPPFLLGGVLWRVNVRHSNPTADPALSTDS